MKSDLGFITAFVATKNKELEAIFAGYVYQAGFGGIFYLEDHLPPEGFIVPQAEFFLLVDHDPPRMDGVKWCKWAIQKMPNAKICLTSGWAKGDFSEILLKNKNIVFIQKPFDFYKFMERIKILFPKIKVA